MKYRITNIVPILLDGQIIEAGKVFSSGEGNNYYLGPNLYLISKEQASDPRFFKPYPEVKCQRDLEKDYLYLNNFLEITKDFEDLAFIDEIRFKLGNYFDEYSCLNQYGADIQSVRKCIKLAFKYPKLWGALCWSFDLDDEDSPVSDLEGVAVRNLLQEIEEST